MIEIKYRLRNNSFRLNAVGHAGYAPVGSDIVCSAVTVLLYTFSFAASSLHDNDIADDVSIVMESGKANIEFSFESRQQKTVECALLPIVKAMKMIERRHPQNVCVIQA